MLKIILIAIPVLIIVLVVIAALQPSDFRITRTATISAPPGIVFAQVNDLHKWEAWSPWAKMDPAAKITFEGPPAGTGAGYTWAGNNKVGEGRMTITESKPNERLRFKLEFRKPFEATHTAEFTFQPQGDQTVVTWSMAGTNKFMFKLFGLFMNCDKMVGGQFEQGLADLNVVAKAAGKAQPVNTPA
jgi:uncharacterized protein YndB with AHSA1/START domain